MSAYATNFNSDDEKMLQVGSNWWPTLTFYDGPDTTQSKLPVYPKINPVII